MKIRSIIVAALTLAIGGALYVQAQDTASTEAPAKKKAAVTKSVYVCPKCDVASMKPGKCPKCGAKLVKMHLLGTKDGKAVLCTCGAKCTCTMKGVKDGKCACGKPIKTADIKGMYYCPKGCPVISKTAGKCPGCGAEMVKADK